MTGLFARLAALLVLLAGLTGCADDPVVLVTAWRLDTPRVHDLAVTLPAHFDAELPSEPSRYTLRTSVDLPASFQGQPLTLAIPLLQAPCALRVNGEPMASLDAGMTRSYRGTLHPRWSIPSEISSAGRIDLAIDVEHTWTQSAWFDVPPRLSATPAGDRRYRWIRSTTDATAMTGLSMSAVTSFLYLVVFLADRSRRAAKWLALEFGSGGIYAGFIAGLTPAVFGVYDAPVISLGLCVCVWSGARFAHVQFGLPPPHRLWNLPPILCGAASLVAGGPFWSTRVVTPITVVSLILTIGYQLYLPLKVWRRTESPRQALVLLVSWGALGASGIPDFVAWMGLGELAGGLRIGAGCIGFMSVLQSTLLGLDHIASLRRTDGLNVELANQIALIESKKHELEVLNVELRRQVAARSEHLAHAIARLSVARGAPELQAGEIIDERYRVVAPIGRGAMGVVYEITRISDGRRLAMKLLLDAGAVGMARFAREATILSRVQHPNVVSVLDVDVAGAGFFYIVIDYVEGKSLDRHDARFGDARWALPLLRQIAEGLTAIHELGIVHRDLKPANVLLAAGENGSAPRAMIADFGISRLTEALGGVGSLPPPSAGSPHGGSPGGPTGARDLTETGMLMGTPKYMAPELVGDSRVATTSSDVFSFGVIAYELLAREPPYPQPAATLFMHNMPIPAPRPLVVAAAGVTRSITALIERAVADDPSLRPTAQELARALADVVGGS